MRVPAKFQKKKTMGWKKKKRREKSERGKNSNEREKKKKKERKEIGLQKGGRSDKEPSE